MSSRPTRLNAGSLSLFLKLTVKRGLDQPYPNLVGNWSRSPEEPEAGRNQCIVPLRKAGLRGEAPHGPPEQCSSSELVTYSLAKDQVLRLPNPSQSLGTSSPLIGYRFFLLEP
ncbi:hypothetical protein HAX54_002293 [Datura stramonium]|uniref:Uncharacterized protein n=1 Tax=Datura stramonium TaxID=4076 RepID=A0ABS8T3N3_DATST|nr:hypothetical protein [Datura stramonium]